MPLRLRSPHPGLMARVFELQVSLSQAIQQASSITQLNAQGQAAFECLNDFAQSLSFLGLSDDEAAFLNDCVDDARIALRGRAELRMLMLQGGRGA